MDIMTLSEVFDRSIEILKKHIKTIILFSLVYGVLLIISMFVSVIIGAILIGISGLMRSNYLVIFSEILVALFVTSIGLSQFIGMIKISSQEFLGEKVLTDTAVKTTFKNTFKVFAIVVCLLIIFIPFAAFFYYTSEYFFGTKGILVDTVNLFIGKSVGFIVLLIIFLLFIVFILFSYMTWIAFVFHAAILEKKGVFASIKRSFVLVRHSFWGILGSLVLTVFIVTALQTSLGGFVASVSGVFYLITKFLNINKEFMSFLTMVAGYISFPVNLISWLIILPIGYIMTTMLYFNERFKKEGYDLTLRLREFQKNNERKQVSEFNN